MSELGKQFRQYMVLRGFAAATKESYEGAMIALVRAHGGISPDQLTCDQVQAHLARLIGERRLSWNTVNVHACAFRCFYRDVLKRREDEFSLPPRGRARQRPTILDRASVAAIMAAHTNLKQRALLAMVYGSGLRVSEVCRLRPCHIESAPDRMMVRVEQGKGHKDRYTLLSRNALLLLRQYWLRYRPGNWLFPGAGGKGPISIPTAQRVYRDACLKAGVDHERAGGIHTLRHCFASHLMEDGVALPVIQKLLGHSSLKTTSVYCHVSRALIGNVRSPADTLGEGSAINTQRACP
jgi:site-specific recombinase XerD